MPRVLTIALIALLMNTQASAQLPVETYAAPPNVDLVTLSPSGRLLASRRTSDEADVIVVYDLEAGRMVSGIDVSYLDPLELSFQGESQLVISVLARSRLAAFKRYHQKRTAWLLDLETGRIRILLNPRTYYDGGRVDIGHTVAATPDTASLLLAAYGSAKRSLDLYKVRTNRSRFTHTAIDKGNRDTIDWFADMKNDRFIRVDLDDADNSLAIWLIGGDSTELLYKEKRDGIRVEPVGLAPDLEAILVKAFSAQGRVALYSLPFDGGDLEGPLFARPDRDVGRVLTDANRVVVGVEFTGFHPTYEFFDGGLTSRIASLQAMSPGSAVSFRSHDEDFNNVVLHVSGGYSPGAWILARKDTAAPELIALERPSFGGDSVSPTSILEFPARDGLNLSALVTAANDVHKGGDAPLIVLLNAGLEPHDRIGFDWIAQYLASRGYAVLLPQVRGTFGLGQDSWTAGHGKNHAERSHDLEDSIQHAVDLGIAEPGRTCIVGVGYGGYAALAASLQSADLYQCVVSINGVSDPSLAPTFRRFSSVRRKDLEYHWGLLGRLRYDGASTKDAPLTEHAERMKSPVLLMHVEKDSVIPAEQSRVMHEALIQHQKSSRFVELKGHDHWLTDFDTRRSVLETTAGFIEEHLGSSAE